MRRRACATATAPIEVRHAHGYIVQTLADLGLVGLVLDARAARRVDGRGGARHASVQPTLDALADVARTAARRAASAAARRGCPLQRRARRACSAWSVSWSSLRRPLADRLDLVRARRRLRGAAVRGLAGRTRAAVPDPRQRPRAGRHRRRRRARRIGLARPAGAARSGRPLRARRRSGLARAPWPGVALARSRAGALVRRLDSSGWLKGLVARQPGGPRSLGIAAAAVAASLLAAWAQWQPQRSVDASQQALALLGSDPRAALRCRAERRYRATRSPSRRCSRSSTVQQARAATGARARDARARRAPAAIEPADVAGVGRVRPARAARAAAVSELARRHLPQPAVDLARSDRARETRKRSRSTTTTSRRCARQPPSVAGAQRQPRGLTTPRPRRRPHPQRARGARRRAAAGALPGGRPQRARRSRRSRSPEQLRRACARV